jgi:hypothetical protein
MVMLGLLLLLLFRPGANADVMTTLELVTHGVRMLLGVGGGDDMDAVAVVVVVDGDTTDGRRINNG